MRARHSKPKTLLLASLVLAGLAACFAVAAPSLAGDREGRSIARRLVLPAVAVENSRLYPSTAWQPLEPNGAPHAVEGYASQVSVVPGQRLELHVSTRPAARYQIQIFRLGWYRGLGGRLLAAVPSVTRTLLGRPQPLPLPDQTTGMVRAAWPVTEVFRIPRRWVSGYYVAKLVLAQGGRWPILGRSAVVPFIVRQAETARPTPILVISSVNTEQAYNSWGGKSLYKLGPVDAANHVSFDRPYAGQLVFFERRLVSFLESWKDLNLSYATDVDVQRNPALLLRHRLILVNGHDEYWSKQMRDAYEMARDRGINLAFFGGNIGDWQIRYEDRERTIVAYKDATTDPDPNQAEKTTHFSRLRPPRPQCQLIGTQFYDNEKSAVINSFRIGPGAGSDPWFRGTGFRPGDTFSAKSFEYDVAAPGCVAFPTTTLFSAAADPNLAPAVRYRAASGATVFGVGSYALSTTFDDRRVRRLVHNIVRLMSR